MNVDVAIGVHFEEEIIMDILSRLPVRSILRFKCVSKFWNAIIYEPYFKMKHFNRAKNNQNSLKFLVSQWCPKNDKLNTLYCSSLSSVQQVEDVQEVDCPSNGKPGSCRIYCCYNGLAVIGVRNHPDKTLIFLLWNPSTRESIVLPDQQFLSKKSYICGLGYDSTSDDYKILKILPLERSEILALKGGSWRKIDKHPTHVYPVLSDMDSTLAFVHGSFHWLGTSLNNSVVSFSISNEVYGEISLPEGMFLIFNNAYIQHGISVLGGMLCVYSTYTHKGEDTFKLWTMKEYGVKESWNQLFTIQGTGLFLAIPIYMFSDGEVLFRSGQSEYGGYVFKTSRGPFRLWPQSDTIQNGFVYIESLISPKLTTTTTTQHNPT